MMDRRALLLPLVGLCFASCTHVQGPPSAISERAACEIDSLRDTQRGGASAQTHFCVHEVTALTPIPPGNNCAPEDLGFAVGDNLCINCKKGSCPVTTSFATDDGVFLRACRVDTSRTNSACKEYWPPGTCKFYVTLG